MDNYVLDTFVVCHNTRHHVAGDDAGVTESSVPAATLNVHHLVNCSHTRRSDEIEITVYFQLHARNWWLGLTIYQA